VRNPGSIALLGPLFAVNAAFFMGLFFLVSGYFVPGPFARQGAAVYAKGRLVRLGIPLVVMMAGIFFPLAWAGYHGPLGPVRFFAQTYFTNPNAAVGHMWFVADLLVFTLAWVAWRVWRGAPRTPVPALPSHAALVAYAVGLGLVTALVRVRYPVDRWVTWLVLPSEPAHLPQYLSLFAIGIVASRGEWFDGFPRRAGLTWLAIGVGAALAFYGAAAAGCLPALVATGGWRSGNLVWSVWEAFICVGLCVGLVVGFREFMDRPSARLAGLAESTYAVYVVHVPIVVVLQGLLLKTTLPIGAKFLLVTAAGIVLSFRLAGRLRRSAPVRRVL
jgi:fucose 4-O-acetylase-like acetyltransferase